MSSEDKRKRTKRSQYVEYGGKTDRYVWDQWEDELVVNVKFSPGTKGKDVECVLHKKFLKLVKRGEEPVFNGELEYEIDVDASSWTISDGQVEIILVKGVNSETWWSCVQKGHPKIDIKDIEGAKYLDDSILRKIYEQKKAQKKAAQEGAAKTETVAEGAQ
eukprot:TRINITY_DN1880_c0_g1_i3.p1 TRINITY_DN1880_c0_g1~~TRINITY_DN1880_c0_g1_i3.p1  ORF type:complete len:161 (-),score=35.38 TRINITY_DN1880_c0_g1_i3:148-630(-)